MRRRVLKVVPNLDSTAKFIMANLMGSDAFLFPMRNKAYIHIFRHFGVLGKSRKLWACFIAPPMGTHGPLAVWE